jgi:hypothetical protein
MSEKIGPCPMCGGTSTRYDYSHRIRCQGCGHSGPMARSVTEGIRAWNKADIRVRKKQKGLP